MNNEKYLPSQEEQKRAEVLMSDEQREMTKERYHTRFPHMEKAKDLEGYVLKINGHWEGYSYGTNRRGNPISVEFNPTSEERVDEGNREFESLGRWIGRKADGSPIVPGIEDAKNMYEVMRALIAAGLTRYEFGKVSEGTPHGTVEIVRLGR